MDVKTRSKDFLIYIEGYTHLDEVNCYACFEEAAYGIVAKKYSNTGEPVLDCYVRFRFQKSVSRLLKHFGSHAVVQPREEHLNILEVIANCKSESESCKEFGEKPVPYKRHNNLKKTASTIKTTPECSTPTAIPVAAEVTAEVVSAPAAVLQPPAVVPPPPTTDRDLVIMLIRENSELKNLMIEQQSKLLEAVLSNNYHQNTLCNGSHNVVNSDNSVSTNINHNNNSHNKTFNLNVFLNETCKNAMNMSEFVDSINLELADLMRVGELGFVDGISDIILKNLRALEITERPIHCTDKKRETFYVKDDNRWEKETPENQKIKAVISRVANKNYRLVDEYKRSHPDCHRSHSIYCDQYNKIIVEATGGDLDIPRDVKDKRIIHKISKEVGVHDSSA